MRQKGIISIPFVVAIITAVVLFSTTAYFLAADRIQAPGFLKTVLSPLIKKTEKLGKPEGLQIHQVTEKTEGVEAEEPVPNIFSEVGIWELLKKMFSPGYFKKLETPGQGEEADEGKFYEQTKQETIVLPRTQMQTKCSWEITREELEKLGLHCSSIAGYYYGPAIVGMPSDEYDCNPVPGCQYNPEIVPFETKEECEAVCGGIHEP